VRDLHDKRTVFCQRACEEKYWKHGYLKDTSHRPSANIGLSGGMSLGSLIRRERRDLD
jgi:hypothetical protein